MADAEYVLANAVIDFLRNSPATSPTALKLKLWTAPPAKDGTGGTAITGAAQTCTLTAPSNGVSTLGGSVAFTSWTAGEIATHWSIIDTSGTPIYILSAFGTPVTASGGGTVTIAASDVTVQVQ